MRDSDQILRVIYYLSLDRLVIEQIKSWCSETRIVEWRSREHFWGVFWVKVIWFDCGVNLFSDWEMRVIYYVSLDRLAVVQKEASWNNDWMSYECYSGSEIEVSLFPQLRSGIWCLSDRPATVHPRRCPSWRWRDDSNRIWTLSSQYIILTNSKNSLNKLFLSIALFSLCCFPLSCSSW